MKSETALIAVNGLSKSFTNDSYTIQVLNEVAFSIQAGELVAVIGPSGVGKSTLLHLLGTLDRPDTGELLYEGVNPFLLADQELARFRNQKIGFVFQFHHLLPEFSALENVMLPALIFDNDVKLAREKALTMMQRVGLEGRLHHRPNQLSGGERQRVAIARALINNPLIVLADEPTGNLDMENSRRLIQLILEINQKYNTTFIIATHNPEISAAAQRVLTLTQGKVL